jgi:hypothetical protein
MGLKGARLGQAVRLGTARYRPNVYLRICVRPFMWVWFERFLNLSWMSSIVRLDSRIRRRTSFQMYECM